MSKLLHAHSSVRVRCDEPTSPLPPPSCPRRRAPAVVPSPPWDPSFNSLVDWRTARIRYSQPEYVQPGEWVSVSTNFTDFRMAYNVEYGSPTAPVARPPLQDRMPLPLVGARPGRLRCAWAAVHPRDCAHKHTHAHTRAAASLPPVG